MKVDDICEAHGDNSVGLTLRLLDNDPEESGSTVLIEGPPEALRMLACLISAVAEHESGDGFGISPRGAGNFHFSPTATLGVYINRVGG